MHVAVIGGGVIGVSIAHELQRSGVDVTLLEAGGLGEEASHGNAGWIVPALSVPLNGPGLVQRVARMTLNPRSPLRVRTVPNATALRWMCAMVAQSLPDNYRRNLRAALTVAKGTHELFEGLRSDARMPFEMHRDGLLAVFLREKALAAFVHGQATLADHGYDSDGAVLDGAAARRFEPALSDSVVGAVHLPHERSIDPYSLVTALANEFAQMGGRTMEHCPVRGLQRNGRFWRVDTSREAVQADKVVAAAGAWTNRLLSGLGLRILMQPARGCSLTSSGHGTAPRTSLKLAEAEIACSPISTGVRLSGTFDVVPDTARLSRRRLQGVLRRAHPYFRDWSPDPVNAAGWSGLRPTSPDGLPFVGPVPGHQGLVLATGHGNLGVTLAPVTARAVAEIICKNNVPEPFVACRPDRFGIAGP